MFLFGTLAGWRGVHVLPCAPLGLATSSIGGGPLHYNASNHNGPTFDDYPSSSCTSVGASSFPNKSLYGSLSVGVQAHLRIDRMKQLQRQPDQGFVIHEDVKLQFRAESLNLANRPLFESPNMTVTATTFGMITSTTNVPRPSSSRSG